MIDQKRAYRQTKRELKNAGKRSMRNHFKRSLRDHPEEAQWDEFSYGFNSTTDMNGMFPDTKRNNNDKRSGD